jgi:hypothetical protein
MRTTSVMTAWRSALAPRRCAPSLNGPPRHEDAAEYRPRMRRSPRRAAPAKEAVGSALVAATHPRRVGLLATVSCTGYANWA